MQHRGAAEPGSMAPDRPLTTGVRPDQLAGRRSSGPGRRRWRRRAGRAVAPVHAHLAPVGAARAARPTRCASAVAAASSSSGSTTASRKPASAAPSGSYILAPTVALLEVARREPLARELAAQRGSTMPICGLDQPDAERAARADALVGAEQQQRAGRDRVAGARDDHRDLRSEQARDQRAAVGHELPGRGRARAHHLEVEAAREHARRAR